PAPDFEQPNAPPPATATFAPVAAKPPKAKKGGAKKILLPAIALVLVAALAVTGVMTNGFGLLKKNHPMAAFWGGAKQLLMTEGFNATLDVGGKSRAYDYETDGYTDEYETDAYTYEAALKWGKDVRSSTIALRGLAGADYWDNIAYYNEQAGYWYEYGSGAHFDAEEYLLADDINDDLSDEFGFDVEQLANKLLKSGKLQLFDSKGKWNTDLLLEVAEPLRAQWQAEADTEYAGLLGKAKLAKVLSPALNLVDGFFEDYCGKKEVQDKIFSDYKKTTTGGATTYTFTLDLAALTDALEDYLLDAIKEKKYKDLVAYAKDFLAAVESEYDLDDLISIAAAEFKSELREWGDVPVQMTVDKQGRITALEVVDYAMYDDEYTLKLQVSNYGSPKIDTADLEAKIARCKEEYEGNYY
ncbi:MAG: hypothetical protein LBS96_07490, partial [Oscillospiraceae bacterium]|nr:hypothetical protein [Oscillospiraceae bacterium]